MSEKTKKLVHIILPDFLNYLESGEIIEKCLEKYISQERKEEKDKNILDGNKKLTEN